MPDYGKESRAKLKTVCLKLRIVAWIVIKIFDVTIVWGWRDEDQQNEAFEAGNSSKQWPDSKHNRVDKYGNPRSEAIDLAPWPQVYKAPKYKFYFIAGLFLMAAWLCRIKVRWGGSWDGNYYTFKGEDLGHFETK